MSTSNPNAKYDWFKLGGRWDKILPGCRNHMPLKECIEWIEAYKDAAGESLASTFAILCVDETYNSHWHERGELGWFGAVAGRRADWDKSYAGICRDFLTKYPDAYAVLVDYHI